MKGRGAGYLEPNLTDSWAPKNHQASKLCRFNCLLKTEWDASLCAIFGQSVNVVFGFGIENNTGESTLS